MQRLRKTSIILLSLTSFLGILRGIRLATYTGTESILYPYPRETIKYTIFSSYAILGWIIFTLVGLFGMVVVWAIVKRMHNYGYFIIVEGIFITFLSAIHIIITGFVSAHLLLIPICLGVLVLGMLQVPKEF